MSLISIKGNLLTYLLTYVSECLSVNLFLLFVSCKYAIDIYMDLWNYI